VRCLKTKPMSSVKGALARSKSTRITVKTKYMKNYSIKLVTTGACLLFALSLLALAVTSEPDAGMPDAVTGPGFDLLATVPLPTTADAGVAVNEALNKIYTSGNATSLSGFDVVVIDGMTFATTTVSAGGEGANVDVKTDRYWAATVFGGSVVVRDGTTNSIVTTVPLSDCPIETTYDFSKNRVWAGAQCGGGNDPVFAINANTPFNVIAGPIGSGGVMGSIIANGANGRLYLTASGVSKKVDPTTFAVTSTAFGTVMAINTLTNKLYATGGNNLQIINGATEVIQTTIGLTYTPASMGINTELGHLYLANSAGNSLEVRNPSTGALIATFSLATFGDTPNGAMTVDRSVVEFTSLQILGDHRCSW
jgi:hypothetical protein